MAASGYSPLSRYFFAESRYCNLRALGSFRQPQSRRPAKSHTKDMRTAVRIAFLPNNQSQQFARHGGIRARSCNNYMSCVSNILGDVDPSNSSLFQRIAVLQRKDIGTLGQRVSSVSGHAKQGNLNTQEGDQPRFAKTQIKRPGVAVRRAFLADVEQNYPKICLRRSPTNPNNPKPRSMLEEGSGVGTEGVRLIPCDVIPRLVPLPSNLELYSALMSEVIVVPVANPVTSKTNV